ncbi:hypothetical protein Ddye_001135 [Dipteronia dyeriana]|uniref:Uncharacterized protein n=1 Tax=Dipteronia dyeriana TaxID=168575 RepID=A0AAE0CT81_9ROSI|nr:hypothetical protein Ddye_001135 [Dipteronia dyeriana]
MKACLVRISKISLHMNFILACVISCRRIRGFLYDNQVYSHLIGEGSRRCLSSAIRFDIDPKLVSQLSNKYCEVIFVERLPFGVFADPFELQHLHQHAFTDVAFCGDTNLELPSFLSNQSVVEVHMKVDLNSLLTHKRGLEILVVLPLHARYPHLDESGYSIVEFGDPNLFMHC